LKKSLKGDHGDIDLCVFRDRNGSFKPYIIKKGEARLTCMGDQLLSLYAKGMSIRDIEMADGRHFGFAV
jgi:transposase-like protein